MKGIVFDIRRFSIHDGPGIRTTVFTKGCALNCLWCQNPEGISSEIELWYFENKCVFCKTCNTTCPIGAIKINKPNIKPFVIIDKLKCTKCGLCVNNCPAYAIVFCGQKMSSSEVLKEIKKDVVFYNTSNGGVTISGGDPLYQYKFNLEILKKCKIGNIHTAIETNLFSQWDIIKQFIKYVDLFIVDLKLWDLHKHCENTNKANTIIKDNFYKLAKNKTKMVVRIPMIPRITATKNNIKNIVNFVYKTDKTIPVELVNFNPLAKAKYCRMDKRYKFSRYKTPFSEEVMEKYRRIVQISGIKILRGM